MLRILAENVSAWLAGLWELLFGPPLGRPLYDRLSGAHLLSSAVLFLLVAAINALAAAILCRRLKRLSAISQPGDWRVETLRVLGTPLYLLIWVFGFYFAVTPLVINLGAVNELHPLRQLRDRLFDLGVFVCIFWLFWRVTWIIERHLTTLAAKSESKWDDLLVPLLVKSLRVVVPVIAIILALPVIDLPQQYSSVLSKASSLLIVGVVAWISFQAVATAEQFILARYDITAANNLQARKVYTQVRVISKTLYVVIGIFATASALMLFEEVRRLGTSMLASAGVVGIIVGFAAQRTIANLFAGFQLAMTQPIRIDDVVIVEGEWGHIEEFTLTYVVVHIWDDRRLIVPLSYFIDKPFQNWTRVGSQILGSVVFWADYTLPVDEVRREAQRIVESSKDWDHRFWNLQVTDVTDRAVQLRVLVTAADSSKSWDVRCEIREKLLTYIQQRYPQSLPQLRAVLPASPSPHNNNHEAADLVAMRQA